MNKYKSIDSSRDLYTSIRNANRLLRRAKALREGGGGASSVSRNHAIKSRLIGANEYLSFEVLLILRKVSWGLSVLSGWGMVLSLVIYCFRSII